MAPPLPTSSISAPPMQSSSSGSRSRTNARKKPNDDAPYPAPASASAASSSHHKRGTAAADGGTGGGGDSRTKRAKRTTAASAAANDDVLAYSAMMSSGASVAGQRRQDGGDQNGAAVSLIDFSSLSTAELHRYLVHHDIVPFVHPSPLNARDPPTPAALLQSVLGGRRSPSLGPVRPNREPAASGSRRRSARVYDDDNGLGGGGGEDDDDAFLARAPILADVHAVHGVLAQIAHHHASTTATGAHELDTLAAFAASMQTKGSGGSSYLQR